MTGFSLKKPRSAGTARMAACMALLAALLSALTAVPAAAQVTIQWFGFERSAVPDTLSAPVAYAIQLSGSHDSVRLDLASGGSIPLAAGGGGLWTATVPAADLLFGYDATDAGHNLVGTLRVFLGAAQQVALNTLICVADSTMASVAPQSLGPDAQYTGHVVNIHRPGLTYPPPATEVFAVAQRFYQDFPDDYDFLNIVFSLPSYQSNRTHQVIKNDVLGIGLSVFDGSATYGSAGRLGGINRFPIDTLFDLAETGNLHEIGHQWINFCSYSTLQPGPHWPPGTQARGVMGWGAGQGLNFPYDLLDIGGGQYQMVVAPLLREFTDLDLYLMGLLGPADVDSNFVFSNPAQPVCPNCSGPVTWFTVDDVIQAQGPRVPDVTQSPKVFRGATIVVTRDRLLDDAELRAFDHFAWRGEATVSLPFRSGLSVGTTLPFALATGGRGALVTSIAPAATGTPLPGSSSSPAAAATLSPARPNPFRGATEIRFGLARSQDLSLRIHDVRGRLVRTLREGRAPAGEGTVRWDGRNQDGNPVPAGVYFFRLETEAGSVSRRAVILQ